MGQLKFALYRKIKFILKSLNFDYSYYSNKYSDVAESGMNPFIHYVKYGWREGRYNSFYDELENTMDCKAYLKRYPDVAKSGMDPILHYLRHGKVEGRIISNKDSINSRVNNSYLATIKNSPYWDEGWYISYYREVKQTNIDPAMHYLLYGSGGSYSPGPVFNSREYLLMLPNVKAAHMNPLLHYEKFGRKEMRPISLADIKRYQVPDGAGIFSRVFNKRNSFDKHIVTVLASFSGNGKVADYVLYLIKGLREVSDYIILVCDNHLFPEEEEKLKIVCDACICDRHEEYDFGSYKRGIAFLEKQGILTEKDELLLTNDSYYGPVHSFVPVIERLHELGKDFCGLSATYEPIKHISSFFYLFSSKVWQSEVFRDFFQKVKKEIALMYVVYNYEFKLTKLLSDAGFSWDTFISEKQFELNHPGIPSRYGLTLLKEYAYPVIKIKVLLGLSFESSDDTLDYIREENKELYDIIMPHFLIRKYSINNKRLSSVSPYTLRKRYEEQVVKLREKSRKEKLKIVFLVHRSSMFPGQGLMEKMLEDRSFNIELYVVPDVNDPDMLHSIKKSYKEVSAEYPFAKLAVELGEEGITDYYDVVKGADLVCYPFPYEQSYSLYNPYYAVQNNILSLYINYGFPHTKYDYHVWQLYNFSNFWKVYMENELILEEYRKYGRCEACNAEVVGYAKMDRLANVNLGKNITERKKIIIAPHHSIDSETNEILMLSNFYKYSELFLKLPEDYPEINFIFRPHPLLFPALRKPSRWGEECCNEYLEKMCSFPNVEYSTEGDYMEVFAQSDGIIQDCGSFLAEYFYTGKACCYMLKEEEDIKNKFHEFGQECLKHCYIAYEEEDIRRFLDEVIVGGNDPMKEDRDKFRKDVVMLNYPHVADVILERLKKELTVYEENRDHR